MGRPETGESSRDLAEENQVYSDILAVNIDETYRHLTLKILVAMKFVTCFCPHAEYFVRADDDTFINVAALDRELSETEKKLNGNRLKMEEHANYGRIAMKPHKIFMGQAKQLKAGRPNWMASSDNHFEQRDMFYMSGHLYAISMSVVEKLSLDCPYLCFSLDPSPLVNSCSWKLEDKFIGSCIHYTQPDTIIVDRQQSMFPYSWYELGSRIKVWKETGLIPVSVHLLKDSDHFYLLSVLFHFLETSPLDHPVKSILAQLFSHL